MKSFLRRKWHRLPVGIITVILLTCLVTGSAFAGALAQQDQTVTQIIETNYGTITAPAIDLPNVKAGEDFSKTLDDFVIVELGPSGVGEELCMSATPDLLYTSFSVTLTLTGKADGSELVIGTGYAISGGGIVGIQLDAAGTYTFTETVSGTAGSGDGDAVSTVTFTLEEYTGPEPHQ